MTSIPAPQSLADAIRKAREAPERADTWSFLLNALQVSPAELILRLNQEYRIAVLTNDELCVAAPLTSPGSLNRSNDPDLWIELQGRKMLLASDPWASQTLAKLGSVASSELVLALPGQMEAVRKLLIETTGLAMQPPAQSAPSAEAARAGLSPVVAFVDRAISRALQDFASDIHFETDRNGITVRFRIDGVMSFGERLQNSIQAEEVISRIKVMSQLDITERRRPQDGRIHWNCNGEGPLDLRVSIMPSIFGEDAVLRLLDKAQLRQSNQSVTLNGLGFDSGCAARIRSLANRPHGMLLVTGPTGSGKTTTVYAALSEVNTGLDKIVTIEDPVEYELTGVLQIPVNEQKGLTFATGLRSILRHDPDKILVGEIRDAETAEIAVQSSLTGHLVMTTVHANSLFDVLGRFQHFSIDPFGLASALNGVIVQRLLRRLCSHCVRWRTAVGWERDVFQLNQMPAPDQLPEAVGCDRCRRAGYKGRLVVAEVHVLSDLHRDLISSRATMSEIRATVYTKESTQLIQQALACSAAGTTSMEEIQRVVGVY